MVPLVYESFLNPVEIIERILKYLKAATFFNFGMAFKQYKKIILDPKFWRHVKFKDLLNMAK